MSERPADPHDPGMTPPAHPEDDDAPPGSRPARTLDRTAVAVLVVVAALLALMVILHLSGVVGPGAHG
ncbi:MAG: hypothetical protein ACRD0A_14900 [Acidimicrobiales bacterium]